MKSFKKYFIITFCIFLISSLSSCFLFGDDDEKEDPEDENPTTQCTLRIINSPNSYYSITDIRGQYSLTSDPSCDPYYPSTYGSNLLSSNLSPNYYYSVTFPDYSYIDWYFENSYGTYGYDDNIPAIASKQWGSEEINSVVWDDTTNVYSYYNNDQTVARNLDPRYEIIIDLETGICKKAIDEFPVQE